METNVYNILASSSKGNAVLYNGNSFLVDLGISYEQIKLYEKDIKIVFITHIHSDHFNKSAIRLLALNNPLIMFVCGSFLRDEMLELVRKEQLFIVEPNKKYRLLKDFYIKPFNLYHNVDNMGLKMEFKGLKVFHATDTYTLDGIEAVNYDYYLIERNYDEEIAQRIIDRAEMNVEFSYVRSSVENHLSKQKGELWLAKNNKNRKGKVVFLHESDIAL